MQINEIKPIHKAKRKRRVGRGGKRGTYSGRGVKGQKSRAGRKMPPIIREIIKRYPKLRGYRYGGIKKNLVATNLDVLAKNFGPEEIISPETLIKKRIIRKIDGKVPEVKILSRGELTKKITVENCQVSKEARAKIEKAGGNISSIL